LPARTRLAARTTFGLLDIASEHVDHGNGHGDADPKMCRIQGSVGVTDVRMGDMAVYNWDAPGIHPSEIKVGDVIGTTGTSQLSYTVKLIGAPQKIPRQWTFFGRDDQGLQHTSTFGENQLVRRFAK
jgi:hypothetical protein